MNPDDYNQHPHSSENLQSLTVVFNITTKTNQYPEVTVVICHLLGNEHEMIIMYSYQENKELWYAQISLKLLTANIFHFYTKEDNLISINCIFSGSFL